MKQWLGSCLPLKNMTIGFCLTVKISKSIKGNSLLPGHPNGPRSLFSLTSHEPRNNNIWIAWSDSSSALISLQLQNIHLLAPFLGVIMGAQPHMCLSACCIKGKPDHLGQASSRVEDARQSNNVPPKRPQYKLDIDRQENLTWEILHSPRVSFKLRSQSICLQL